jgi:hypothetical protein
MIRIRPNYSGQGNIKASESSTESRRPHPRQKNGRHTAQLQDASWSLPNRAYPHLCVRLIQDTFSTKTPSSRTHCNSDPPRTFSHPSIQKHRQRHRKKARSDCRVLELKGGTARYIKVWADVRVREVQGKRKRARSSCSVDGGHRESPAGGGAGRFK